jgi:PPOX class probable F420-dependent enzyme
MDADIRAYLEKNRAASMVTLRRNGTPHATRVGIGLHGDNIWSSGTETRVRTKHLRRDPRSTLFVFDSQEPGGWRWLTLECTVTILDGPDAAQLNLGFFKAMQSGMMPARPPGKLSWFGQTKTEEEFLQAMRDERRLIYEFNIDRTYGMYGGMPTG